MSVFVAVSNELWEDNYERTKREVVSCLKRDTPLGATHILLTPNPSVIDSYRADFYKYRTESGRWFMWNLRTLKWLRVTMLDRAKSHLIEINERETE